MKITVIVRIIDNNRYFLEEFYKHLSDIIIMSAYSNTCLKHM